MLGLELHGTPGYTSRCIYGCGQCLTQLLRIISFAACDELCSLCTSLFNWWNGVMGVMGFLLPVDMYDYVFLDDKMKMMTFK